MLLVVSTFCVFEDVVFLRLTRERRKEVEPVQGRARGRAAVASLRARRLPPEKRRFPLHNFRGPGAEGAQGRRPEAASAAASTTCTSRRPLHKQGARTSPPSLRDCLHYDTARRETRNSLFEPTPSHPPAHPKTPRGR
ncbi:unnamed protein product, partial [Ixodes persulcatus]